jgi:hypothetical protein
MTLTLAAETEQLIAGQVRSGRFATAEAAVAAAVFEMFRESSAEDVGDDGAVW